MIFQVIILSLIILATLFWAWQGAFSCSLMLAAALFGSTAAIGFSESLMPLITGFRPDYARPVAFFLVFAFGFAVIRTVGGIVAPKNVRLPKLIDLSIGFPLAFLTAMTAFGTLVLALEMVPTYQKIFGYDRYPNGLAKEPVKLWIPADDFVQWVWRQTSGGSLGGNDSFIADHPDLGRELYGNRHVVEFGSAPALPPELLDVPVVYEVTDPAAMRALQITPVADEKLVVVRSQVTKGEHSPVLSSDHDENYRVTPAQVRLITTGEGQYNPIGYLEGGTVFTSLDVDLGHLVDDYNAVPDANLIHDWVFSIPSAAEPRYFEEKALGRKNIAAILATETTPPPAVVVAAAKGYPPEEWKKYLPSLQVVVTHSYGDATDQPVADRPFYLFRNVIVKRRIRSYIDECYDTLEKGNRTDRENWLNIFRPMKVQWDDDHLVPISQFLQFWFVSHETPSAHLDVQRAEREIQDKVLPILLDPEKHLLVWSTKTGPDGKTPTKKMGPGDYVAVIWIIEGVKDDLHFWNTDINVPKATGEPLIIRKLDDTNAYIRKPPA